LIVPFTGNAGFGAEDFLRAEGSDDGGHGRAFHSFQPDLEFQLLVHTL